ncbi:MAG: radical SAM protein [Patescibacteria group bacterium]
MTKLEIPSIPHLVHIETTYACNGRCIFCYNPRRSGKINLDKIDRIVQSIYESWVPHVYLIGGEPSLIGVDKLNEYIKLLSQRSSVTIVTNGLICLNGLSNKLACIGIPIHGNRETHERHSGVLGGYDKTIKTATYYVEAGFDVRCIPVLTAWNFDQMYNIIGLAKKLEMESVFVDRFEDGGIGSRHSQELKPTIKQFQISLGQMIAARDEFGIPVGFGTAIPYCLDERLVTENMAANCGVGITFAAVNPDGDVRICNQSEIIYGNVLEEPIEKIWKKEKLDEFRNLSWVAEPCSSCPILTDCLCGCKVDCSCSSGFCIDYAVRGLGQHLCRVSEIPKCKLPTKYPNDYRHFKLDSYARFNDFHQETYLVTRYQTVRLDDAAGEIIKLIFGGETEENILVSQLATTINEEEVRIFVTRLSLVGAIHFTS